MNVAISKSSLGLFTYCAPLLRICMVLALKELVPLVIVVHLEHLRVGESSICKFILDDIVKELVRVDSVDNSIHCHDSLDNVSDAYLYLSDYCGPEEAISKKIERSRDIGHNNLDLFRLPFSCNAISDFTHLSIENGDLRYRNFVLSAPSRSGHIESPPDLPEKDANWYITTPQPLWEYGLSIGPMRGLAEEYFGLTLLHLTETSALTSIEQAIAEAIRQRSKCGMRKPGCM